MSDYSATFPTQRPVFSQDFSNGSKIDPRATFSRASTGTFFGTEKVLSSENLLLQSQTLDTSWSDDGGVSLTGSQTAPDGTSTGWLFTASGSGSSVAPRISQAVSLTASTEYTATVHIKAGTATHGYISLRGSASNYAYAQIEFASPGSVSTGGAGFTGISGTVTALGSSYYRITLTATTNSSLSTSYVFVGLNDGSAFTGSGYPTWNTTGETMYAWGAQLNTTGATVYDSPTTTQIARSYQTKLQTAASGAARFENSATDGQSAGILLESSASNLQRYGSDIASWSNQAYMTRSSNQAIAPNGQLEADLLTPSSGTSLHYVFDPNISVTSGTTYTFSIYLKDAGQRFVQLLALSTLQSSGAVNYDLQSGTLSASGAHSGTLESVGNGWFRASVTVSATSTTTTGFIVQAVDSLSSGRFTQSTGNGYNGWLGWGAMVETGSSASSLVDTGTSGSTATRAADSLSVATADIGYTGGPVTLTADYDMVDPTANVAAQNILLLSDGSPSNRVLLYNRSGKSGGYVASADGSTTASGNPSSTAAGAHKLCVVADTNNYIMSFDGTSSTDTAAVLPSGLNQIDIGSGSFSGHVSRVSLFGTAISETAANALTS